jgi:hypothetical protein
MLTFRKLAVAATTLALVSGTLVLGTITQADVIRMSGLATAQPFSLVAPGKFYAVSSDGGVDISRAVCAYQGYAENADGVQVVRNGDDGAGLQEPARYAELRTKDRHYNMLGETLPSISLINTLLGGKDSKLRFEIVGEYVRRTLPEETGAARLKIDGACIGDAIASLAVGSMLCVVDTVLYNDAGLPLGVKFDNRALVPKGADPARCPIAVETPLLFKIRGPLLGVETIETIDPAVRTRGLAENENPARV